MKQYRCRDCRRLLFATDAERGRLHTVCPRCGRSQMVVFGDGQQQPTPTGQVTA